MDDGIMARAATQFLRVERLIPLITYKPNWKISLDRTRQIDPYGTQVYVSAMLRDPETKEKMPFVTSKRLPQFPPECPDAYVIRYIADIVRFAEDEYFKQWLRVDGHRIYETHNERMGINES